MPVLASTIIDRVRNQLIDTASVQRWSDGELLGWLSEGQTVIVAAVPDARSVAGTVAMVAGTRQSLPADGIYLLRAIRNTSGRAVRVVDRDLYDTYNPTWHSATAATEAHTYMFDDSEPTIFYVYPPNNGSGSLEVRYSALPPDLGSTADALSVDAIYYPALTDYLLYRCYQKDSDFEEGQALSQVYLSAFTTFVQARVAGKAGENPNANRVPVR